MAKKFYSPLRILVLALLFFEIFAPGYLVFRTLVLDYRLMNDPSKVILKWVILAILIIVILAMCRLMYLLYFHRNRERNWRLF